MKREIFFIVTVVQKKISDNLHTYNVIQKYFSKVNLVLSENEEFFIKISSYLLAVLSVL